HRRRPDRPRRRLRWQELGEALRLRRLPPGRPPRPQRSRLHRGLPRSLALRVGEVQVVVSSAVAATPAAIPASVPDLVRAPKRVLDTGLEEAVLMDLVLKVIHQQGFARGVDIADLLCLPFADVTETIIDRIKEEKF